MSTRWRDESLSVMSADLRIKNEIIQRNLILRNYLMRLDVYVFKGIIASPVSSRISDRLLEIVQKHVDMFRQKLTVSGFSGPVHVTFLLRLAI